MRLTKKLWLIFIGLMLISNFMLFFVSMISQKPYTRTVAENLVSLSGDITSDASVEVEVEGDGSFVQSVDVFLSTYNRTNEGVLTLSFYDGTDEAGNNMVNMAEIQDNAFHTFPFRGVQLSKGHKYRMVLSSDAKNESVTAWYDEYGLLVSRIHCVSRLTLKQIVSVNITYALINYLFLLVVNQIKRR